MRLISWNLNGRRRDATAQVDALLVRAPDVIALQEVTCSTLPSLRRALESGGFTQITDSFELTPPDFEPRGPRRYGQLTASRYPLTPLTPSLVPVPWPERVLTVSLDAEGHSVVLYNTHVPPGSSNGWIKIDELSPYTATHHVSSAATSTRPSSKR